jgi:hypothetical protein
VCGAQATCDGRRSLTLVQIAASLADLQLTAADPSAEGPQSKVRAFSITAYTGGQVTMAGYYWPVVVDLEGTTVRSQNRPILFSHDATQIVGHSEKISVMAQTIKVSGKSVALRNINSRDQPDKQIWVQSCELRGESLDVVP